MRRFFGIKENGNVVIEGAEFNHLKNVLRMQVGDEVLVSLNDEQEYACEIVEIGKKQAVCKINGARVCAGNPRKNIVLFQAMPKRDKFEFIVQKATEIGITKIVPFMTEHTVAKPTENKDERLRLIALNACKQCERTIVTEIDECKTVDEIAADFKNFDIVLFANERAEKSEKLPDLTKCQNIAVIVGCEGGFTFKEKTKFTDKGALTVSLGKRILRAETASVAMMSMVSILSEN